MFNNLTCALLIFKQWVCVGIHYVNWTHNAVFLQLFGHLLTQALLMSKTWSNQLNLLVKISYWNLAHTIEYTTQQTKFFITCGLCPYPQVLEGMYETKNTLVPIMVRNSSPIMLTFKMGEPIKAFSANTQEFLTKS